jgi:hypothetical protein
VIGNWERRGGIFESSELRLVHAPTSGTERIHQQLRDLIASDTVRTETIRVDLILQYDSPNISLNSHDDANIEIGAMFQDRFIPLNYALINPRPATDWRGWGFNAIPLTIESYLLHDSTHFSAGTVAGIPNDTIVTDSVFITRFNATWRNYVDTIRTDTIFNFTNNKWDPQVDDPRGGTRRRPTNLDTIKFTSDTLVGWRHFVPVNVVNPQNIDRIIPFFTDTLTTTNSISDTTRGADGSIIIDTRETIHLFRSVGETVATITRESKTTTWGDSIDYSTWSEDGEWLYEKTEDRLTIQYSDTVIYRTTRFPWRPTAFNEDSAIAYVRFISALNADGTAPITQTITQSGEKYIVALLSRNAETGRQLRRVGGMDENLPHLARGHLLADTLNMYLRINRQSRQNILHMFDPFIRISYTRTTDDSRRTKNIFFTDVSAVARSADNMQDPNNNDANNIPIISGAMHRFAEIELDFGKFFNEITAERFLHVGLANLRLPLALTNTQLLDTVKTNFPAQYGEFARINAVISETRLTTSKELFALLSQRRISTGRIHRNSTAISLSIVETINDFIRRNKIYENDADALQKVYLYLWLDGHVMGRVGISESEDINFTYILQTRRDGE